MRDLSCDLVRTWSCVRVRAMVSSWSRGWDETNHSTAACLSLLNRFKASTIALVSNPISSKSEACGDKLESESTSIWNCSSCSEKSIREEAGEIAEEVAEGGPTSFARRRRIFEISFLFTWMDTRFPASIQVSECKIMFSSSGETENSFRWRSNGLFGT